MAKGINNRTHLSLPHRVPDEMLDITRNLGTWANGLPFGHSGFQFWKSVNDAAVATGVAKELTFDTVIVDHENWMPIAGTVQSIVVPPGLSGWYVFNFNLYWTNAVVQMYPFIRVNGNAISFGQPLSAVANDSAAIVATWPLKDGDIITAGYLNNTGVNRTVVSLPGDANNLKSPFLGAERISLL